MAVTTQYSPEELNRRIHKLTEIINSHCNSHSFGNILSKINADLQIVSDVEKKSFLDQKLQDAIMKQLFNEAKQLCEYAVNNPNVMQNVLALLDKIEEAFKEMKKSEIKEMNNARFLARMANHLSKQIDKEEQKVHDVRKRIAQHLNDMRKSKQGSGVADHNQKE